MASGFSWETKFRAMVLFFDHVNLADISRRLSELLPSGMRSPTEQTVKNWAEKGEIIGVDWEAARQLSDSTISKITAERLMEIRKPKDFEVWAKQTVSELQEIVTMAVSGLLANPNQIKPRDVDNIIKTIHLLEGRATEIVQHKVEVVHTIGQIINGAAYETMIKHAGNKEVAHAMRQLVDLVKTEFQRAESTGNVAGYVTSLRQGVISEAKIVNES